MGFEGSPVRVARITSPTVPGTRVERTILPLDRLPDTTDALPALSRILGAESAAGLTGKQRCAIRLTLSNA